MWHLSQFSKRLELFIKPSNFGYNSYNQLVLVKIPDRVVTYLNNCYDIGFVDTNGNILYYYSRKFFPETNEIEYYVNMESIDDINYTSLFVYYYSVNIGKQNNGIKVYVYKRIKSLPHPNNHLELVNLYDVNNDIYKSYITNDIYLSENMDYYCYFVICLFYVSNDDVGTWEFAVDGDDAVEVEIDGNIIVSWYGIHGICNCYDHNGSINLSSGWHKLICRHEEYIGGDNLRVYVKCPTNSNWRKMGTTVTSCTYEDYSDSTIYSYNFIFNFAISDSYIVNFLNTTNLVSIIGPNFSNYGAALYQPICDTYAVKTSTATAYVSCSVSKSSFTLFFSCYLVVGTGYLVYFSSSNYVYVNSDGSLVLRLTGTNYSTGSKLYFNVCSTFSITYDGSNVYIVLNGITKLVVGGTISISSINLGGNGSSGYSIECYFFDLFLLSPKHPLYSYYLHNTKYNNTNFFSESGYDNNVINGYLTYWPEVIFAGDQAIFRSNMDIPIGWKYYRPILITNSGTTTYYGNISISLFTDDFGNPYEHINADGSDLYFVSSSGIELEHCLYIWNNTGNSEVIISSSGIGGFFVGNSVIYMYYCSESSISTLLELPKYFYVLHYDNFDIKDESYWHFDGYQTVPYNLNGENVLKIWGNNNWHSYYSNDESIVSGMEVTIDFLRTGSSTWHIAAVENGDSYNRWCIQEDNGYIRVQYKENGGSWIYPKTLLNNVKTNIWYTALLRVDDVNGFYMKIWEKYNSDVYGDYSHVMPTGLTWRFHSWQVDSVVCYHDNYRLKGSTYESPSITTSVSGEIALNDTLIDIQNNIYKDDVSYSVSFNDGNSWEFVNLKPETVFFKDFNKLQEFNVVLRLNYTSQIIDKNYIVKINDFNKFDVDYSVDFTVGKLKNEITDTETDFTVALPTLYNVELTPVEYTYETSMSGLKSLYFSRPVEISWGGTLGSGIISKDVEYCFDSIMDSWTDDTKVDFSLGELYQGYYINYPVDFTLSSGYIFYIDMDVDFILANYRYFMYLTDVICSIACCMDKIVEIKIGYGRLLGFLSDIKTSNMLYDNFNSSVFCSLSGISSNCFFNVNTVSGSISDYCSDLHCSLLDSNNNFGIEVKLNTIIIENFTIDNCVIVGTDFCFSIDVYDTYYGVITSGIQLYMNTSTIKDNEIIDKTFVSIFGGYTVSWCYNIGSLGKIEYVEIIVKATNVYGDLNVLSYFLRYGKRYNYNLYHIIKHEYNKLIPMLMIAENNIDIFPSFSTETMYVRVESYRRANLSASIFGISVDRSELAAEVHALTNNFYNGGYYRVRVECKDLSGNEIIPLEFEFTIRSDGL